MKGMSVCNEEVEANKENETLTERLKRSLLDEDEKVKIPKGLSREEKRKLLGDTMETKLSVINKIESLKDGEHINVNMLTLMCMCL